MTTSASREVNANILSAAIKFEKEGRNLFWECVKKTEKSGLDEADHSTQHMLMLKLYSLWYERCH
jgi:hypothetical protein